MNEEEITDLIALQDNVMIKKDNSPMLHQHRTLSSVVAYLDYVS